MSEMQMFIGFMGLLTAIVTCISTMIVAIDKYRRAALLYQGMNGMPKKLDDLTVIVSELVTVMRHADGFKEDPLLSEQLRWTHDQLRALPPALGHKRT